MLIFTKNSGLLEKIVISLDDIQFSDFKGLNIFVLGN